MNRNRRAIIFFLLFFVVLLSGCSDTSADHFSVEVIDGSAVVSVEERILWHHNLQEDALHRYDLISTELLNAYTFSETSRIHHVVPLENNNVAVFIYDEHVYTGEEKRVFIVMDENFNRMFQTEVENELLFRLGWTSAIEHISGDWYLYNFDRLSPHFYRYNFRTMERENLFELEFPQYIGLFHIFENSHVIFQSGNADNSSRNYFGVYEMDTGEITLFEANHFYPPSARQTIATGTLLENHFLIMIEMLFSDSEFVSTEINVTLLDIRTLEILHVDFLESGAPLGLMSDGDLLVAQSEIRRENGSVLNFTISDIYLGTTIYEFEMNVSDWEQVKLFALEDNIYSILVIGSDEGDETIFYQKFIRVESIGDE